MKKLMTLTLCGMVALGAFAQKATVDQAKKLAGKTDKIEEARNLIKEALQNPETANQAETYYVAGKIEWDAFNKNKTDQAIHPEKVNPIDMANQLLNGYQYFIQVFPLDQVPNEKGEIKPKYEKELQKKIAEKADEFMIAGADLFDAKAYYPEAYNAFMIYGDLPAMEVLGKMAPIKPDTVRAVSYFNAGIAAWSANKVDEAAEAFRKARENNYTNPEAYIYEIACWQNIEQNDQSRENEAKDKIFAAARAGFDKFGMEQPVFLNNMVNSMINSGQEAQAVDLVNEAISSYPDRAALYGLRAFVLDRMDQDEAAEADYRHAASMPDADYETLLNAVKKLYRTGQHKWNDIELGDPDSRTKKADIRSNYFEVAKSLAEKARQMTDDTSDIDYLIENIDYSLSL